MEIYYINKFNSIVPNGYNLRSGGNNGGKHNEETKRKISETLKNNIGMVCNGKRKSAKGFIFRYEN